MKKDLIEIEMTRERHRLGVSQKSKGYKIILTIKKTVVGKRKRKGSDGKLYDTYIDKLVGKYRKPSAKHEEHKRAGCSFNYGVSCFSRSCGFDHEDIFKEQRHGGRCFCPCHKENKHQSVAEILGEADIIGEMLKEAKA